LRTEGALSCTELALLLGLSNPALGKITDELYALGIIVQTNASAAAKKGRRPVRYALNPGRAVSLTVDFTNAAFRYYDITGRIRLEGRFPDTAYYPQKLYALLADIRDQGKAVGLPLVGVFCAIRGKVSFDGTVILSQTFTKDINLQAVFKEVFGVPAVIANDIYFALAAGKETYNNAMYLHIGKGVSCSLVLAGQPYLGSTGFAGEIGLNRLPGGGTVEDALRLPASPERIRAAIDGIFNFMLTMDFETVLIACGDAAAYELIKGRLTEKIRISGTIKTRIIPSAFQDIEDGLRNTALKETHQMLIADRGK
jgi:hypothetical protein